MKIIRDGKEITLTDTEVETAFRERQKHYYAEDVKMKWEYLYGEEFPYSDEEAELIAERAENILSKNDSYWESYWDNFVVAIAEFKGSQN